MDEEHARILAGHAYCHTLECLNWFESVDKALDQGPFFVFEGLGPSAGAFGYFSVNKWTGTVWDLWDCKRIGRPASQAAQEHLRQHFKPEEKLEYDRLNSIKPECD